MNTAPDAGKPHLQGALVGLLSPKHLILKGLLGDFNIENEPSNITD